MTMGHNLLLRSPKGSLKHWTLLIISTVPQSSGKEFLKSAIKKITQETTLGWKEALPTALLCTHTAPKEQVDLSPYEILYGRPFVYVNDLFLHPEAQTLQFYTMSYTSLIPVLHQS